MIKKIFRIRKAWFRAVTRLIWAACFTFIVGLPLYVYAVSINLFGWFGEMPGIADIENPENDLSSEVISADGVSLGRYYRFNRSLVSYEQLSPHLINTLLISEDHRFHDHSGLDVVAFLRVIKGVFTFSMA